MFEMSRYASPSMALMWDQEVKYATWRRVEAEAAKAQGAPERVYRALAAEWAEKAPMSHSIARAEQETRHDVAAFLQVWREYLSAEAASWTHRNMTSSDLVDSANAVRLAKVCGLIEVNLGRLIRMSASFAVENWRVFRVGRTHGQAAEMTSLGYQMADRVAALDRASAHFKRARAEATVVKLSGPVGDYKSIGRTQELAFAEALGLRQSPTASQVVARDGYANLVFQLAQIATIIESWALEIRLSQQSAVGELFEKFDVGQVGSSSMPHKSNPIKSEQLAGVARLLRAQVMPVQEGMALWGERDISHSVVERFALPLVTSMADYAIRTMTQVIDGLFVNRVKMDRNLSNTRGLYSGVMRNALTEAGLSPETAWKLARAAGLSTAPFTRLVEVAAEERFASDLSPLDDAGWDLVERAVAFPAVGNTAAALVYMRDLSGDNRA